MDFDLNEEQRALKDGIDRLLADHYAFEARKKYMASAGGWSRDQWKRYAEMGLLALPFAEAYGGIGGGAVEMQIVAEAFGRALALEPYLATVVLGGGLIRLAGSAEQRATLIPKIADGSLLLAFAQAEQQSRYDLGDVTTTAKRDGNGWVIDGRKRHVLNGDCADKLIVTARTDAGMGLFVIDATEAGVSRRSYPTQDGRRSAEITFDNVRVNADAVLGDPAGALPVVEQVVDLATAALCAEAVGGMSRAHEVTVEYLKMRKQFGVEIGSFQALQHRAVDMLVQVELARSMALYAAMMSEDPNPAERHRAVAAAKVQVGQAGKFVCGQAIQLHGGIGMTDEYLIGHYYRRLTMIDVTFGDSTHHLGALARAGGLSAL